MPMFYVEFSKTIEVSVEAESLEECQMAAKNECRHIDSCWDGSQEPWESCVSSCCTNTPDCGVVGDRIMDIHDYRKSKENK